jgi:anti-sigma-K factor RskA
MATNIEDLAARVARLERQQEERAMSQKPGVHSLWHKIPFSAWLRISGPTFAVMALGFGVLWNAQQETSLRILDLQQSTTDKILALQETTTDRILEMQRTTTDRLLEMQQQLLDLQRDSLSERG